jgi:hypothetical protein
LAQQRGLIASAHERIAILTRQVEQEAAAKREQERLDAIEQQIIPATG